MKKLKWIKRGGPYNEEYTKLSSGRAYKIGIFDGTIILSTKTKKKKYWQLVSEWPLKKNIIEHVKNIVEALSKEPLLG